VGRVHVAASLNAVVDKQRRKQCPGRAKTPIGRDLPVGQVKRPPTAKELRAMRRRRRDREKRERKEQGMRPIGSLPYGQPVRRNVFPY
jgi:hypothetical protein